MHVKTYPKLANLQFDDIINYVVYSKKDGINYVIYSKSCRKLYIVKI